MERLPTRKIHECLRLRFAAGLSSRQIAASQQVSRGSGGEYVRRLAHRKRPCQVRGCSALSAVSGRLKLTP